MTARRLLPNRRRHESFAFQHEGIDYVASVGFYLNGGIGEIFLNAGRPGCAVNVVAHDAAVTISLALQYGTPLAAIRKALLKLPNGQGAGPLGKALDLIDAAASAARMFIPYWPNGPS